MGKDRKGSLSYSTPSFGAREEQVDVLHTPLENTGNTCYFNAPIQALSVTRPLAALISSPPPTSPSLLALSPASPQHAEDRSKIVSPLPITAALLDLLETLKKEARVGRRAHNPRGLLRELGAKHEEYATGDQQDAHELLRHLCDSVMMEEVDLIKKLNPPPAPPNMKKRRMTIRAGAGVQTVPSISARSSASVDDSADEQADAESSSAESESSSDSEDSEAEEAARRKNEARAGGKQMRPFVDSVFGGKLVSVVVCEECQHVSLTQEDFLDISLSLKDDVAKMRKRDRIRKSLQTGFFSKKSAASAPSSPIVPPARRTPYALSETDGSASEVDTDVLSSHEDPPSVSPRMRRLSLDPVVLLESRRPFWSSREGKEVSKSAATSRDPSPLGRALSVLSAGGRRPRRKPKIPKPTREQHAYVDKVLATIPGPSPSPLPAQLRWAQPNKGDKMTTATQSLSQLQLQNALQDQAATDLYECFIGFTQVETLEGDNAFQCRRCWKHLNPELVLLRRAAKEERRRKRQVKQANGAGASLRVATSDMDLRSSRESDIEHFLPVSPTVEVSPPDIMSMLDLADRTTVTAMHSTLMEPLSETESEHLAGDDSSSIARSTDVEDTTDGNLTDSSLTSFRRPNLALTKANVLALAVPPPSHSSSFASDSALSKSTTSGARSAASASTQGTTSTRFVLPDLRPTKVPPKATRHILRRAHKRYLIHPHLPPVLTIHFKRFQQTSKSSMFGSAFVNLKKRDDALSFPQELDLTPFLAPLEGPPRSTPSRSSGPSSEATVPAGGTDEFLVGTAKYRLYAVVVHVGTLREGHFTSFVLSDRWIEREKKNKEKVVEEVTVEEEKSSIPRSRKWFFCSDEIVRQCTLQEVLESKAYMLFYERVPNAPVKSRI